LSREACAYYSTYLASRSAPCPYRRIVPPVSSQRTGRDSVDAEQYASRLHEPVGVEHQRPNGTDAGARRQGYQLRERRFIGHCGIVVEEHNYPPRGGCDTGIAQLGKIKGFRNRDDFEGRLACHVFEQRRQRWIVRSIVDDDDLVVTAKPVDEQRLDAACEQPTPIARRNHN
jgi:hypothetical protein